MNVQAGFYLYGSNGEYRHYFKVLSLCYCIATLLMQFFVYWQNSKYNAQLIGIAKIYRISLSLNSFGCTGRLNYNTARDDFTVTWPRAGKSVV